MVLHCPDVRTAWSGNIGCPNYSVNVTSGTQLGQQSVRLEAQDTVARKKEKSNWRGAVRQCKSQAGVKSTAGSGLFDLRVRSLPASSNGSGHLLLLSLLVSWT